MKTTITVLIAGAILLSTGAAAHGESTPTGGRPFMGVLLDPAPLPRLLSLHLGVAVGQGLRIQNVQVDSPADKAGLERDDLIIRFQGEDLHDYERLVEAIRKAGAGTEVSLQIIHLGVRKTVKLTLMAFEGEPEWKYPREPEVIQSWRPGRFFRLQPGDEDWKEMFKDGIPPDIDIDVKKFFKEVRTYHHSNGEDYSVTIEGNPHDEDSTITVRIDDDKYTTTVKDIDKLPEKYREAAKDALETARRSPRSKIFEWNERIYRWKTPPQWKDYFDKVHPRNYGPMLRLDRSDKILETLEKLDQILRERERQTIIEKPPRDLLDYLFDGWDQEKPEEKEESNPPSDENLPNA
jgi:hypothetical protein